jgi:hypothetical protein
VATNRWRIFWLRASMVSPISSFVLATLEAATAA